jgi:hypothetical protein
MGPVVVLLPIDPARGLYQLSITSAKPDRLTKPVRWIPPASMSVTAITSTENGDCAYRGGQITCVAWRPGPSLTVDFTAKRAGRGDAHVVVTFLDIPRGLYRLSVENTSGLGYINTFNWEPPAGMTITAINSSQGGKCSLLSGAISCRGAGKGIPPPPQCICPGGGTLTVDFFADGLKPTYPLHGLGVALQILTMTPVPYHIPHTPREEVDLPLCRPGGPRPCTST